MVEKITELVFLRNLTNGGDGVDGSKRNYARRAEVGLGLSKKIMGQQIANMVKAKRQEKAEERAAINSKSPQSHPCSNSTRKKLSEINTGRVRSIEARQNYRKSWNADRLASHIKHIKQRCQRLNVISINYLCFN